MVVYRGAASCIMITPISARYERGQPDLSFLFPKESGKAVWILSDETGIQSFFVP